MELLRFKKQSKEEKKERLINFTNFTFKRDKEENLKSKIALLSGCFLTLHMDNNSHILLVGN